MLRVPQYTSCQCLNTSLVICRRRYDRRFAADIERRRIGKFDQRWRQSYIRNLAVTSLILSPLGDLTTVGGLLTVESVELLASLGGLDVITSVGSIDFRFNDVRRIN